MTPAFYQSPISSQQQLQEHGVVENVWDKLDDAIMESILEYLTTVELMSCRLVCKRWLMFILSTPISNRRFNKKRSPWFLLSHNSSITYGILYDSEASLWRQSFWRVPGDSSSIFGKVNKLTPLAASAGLICFRYGSSFFGTTSSACPLLVLNPLNGMVDMLPQLNIDPHLNIRGIAMHELKSIRGIRESIYMVFVLYGNWPNLGLKCFSMSDDFRDQGGLYYWKELPLPREIIVLEESLSESNRALLWVQISMDTLVGVTSTGSKGQILVNFFYKNMGRLICFDTQNGTYFMSRCLASPHLYGRDTVRKDMVKCDERVFMVGVEDPDPYPDSLNEFIQLKIWEMDMEKIELKPQSLICSEKYSFPHKELRYIKPHRICCAGCGDYIMICLESNITNDLNKVVMYNLKENKWTFLPNHLDGRRVEGDTSELVVTSVYGFLPDPGALLVYV